MAALAAGCGASAEASSGADPVITIAYAAPVADQLVPSVTQAAGLFKKYGVNVKVEYLQQSDMLPAMVGGKIQFGSLAAPGYEIVALNGTGIQSIAQWENSFDVVLESGPKYTSMASLNGQSIAISTPGAFSDLLALIAEKKYGITMHEVPLDNLSNGISAFETGSVAAISDISPFQVPAAEKSLPGAHELIDWRTVRDVPGMELIGDETWLKANRGTVVKVVKAINAGIAYFKTHKAQTVRVIEKVTGDPPAESAASYEDTLRAMSSSDIPSLQAEKTVLSYLVQEYPQAATFNAANLIDTSYEKAAGGK
jgi:ABC-type nitrate/sulfonate/bicarbonate transport system substrate-binding protein